MTKQRHAAPVATGAGQRRRNHAIWLGLLLAAVGMATYVYTVRFPALRDFPWVNLPLILTGMFLSAIGLWRAIRHPSVYGGKILGILGLALTFATAVFFNYAIFFVTAEVPAPTTISLSMTEAPDFTLLDQQGRPVRLRDYRGKKVVLTFYRGYW
jgi:hypothetical protein